MVLETPSHHTTHAIQYFEGIYLTSREGPSIVCSIARCRHRVRYQHKATDAITTTSFCCVRLVYTPQPSEATNGATKQTARSCPQEYPWSRVRRTDWLCSHTPQQRKACPLVSSGESRKKCGGEGRAGRGRFSFSLLIERERENYSPCYYVSEL